MCSPGKIKALWPHDAPLSRLYSHGFKTLTVDPAFWSPFLPLNTIHFFKIPLLPFPSSLFSLLLTLPLFVLPYARYVMLGGLDIARRITPKGVSWRWNAIQVRWKEEKHEIKIARFLKVFWKWAISEQLQMCWGSLFQWWGQDMRNNGCRVWLCEYSGVEKLLIFGSQISCRTIMVKFVMEVSRAIPGGICVPGIVA